MRAALLLPAAAAGAPAHPRDGGGCAWSAPYPGQFLRGYPNHTRDAFPALTAAQQRCAALGALCGGVTLEAAGYTPRVGRVPEGSGGAETSWVELCAPTPPPPPPPPPIVRHFVAAALGDHMVLQRAPQQATVWGHTTPGAQVTTVFGAHTLRTTAGADGTWRQRLPATPASRAAHSLSFSSSSGEAATLRDVLFGEVFLCSGQSNMAYHLSFGTNATSEEAAADAYPTIRLFNVGEHNTSTEPFADLQRVSLPWAAAGNRTVADFSAVCWFFGRRVSESLSSSGDVPVGLVESAWGSTSIQVWMPETAFEACNMTHVQGSHYNSMIYPFTVGPMALAGFAWYQGENNVKHYSTSYACMQTEMISGWRAAFQAPDAYFGFVQLSTFCADYAVRRLPLLREQQMVSLRLPKVGYATNADHGAGCYIHPPSKQFVGARLGDSALALQYGKPVRWRSPTYASAEARVVGGAAVVTVNLTDVGPAGLTADVYPHNYITSHLGRIPYDLINCTELNAETPGMCAWASVDVAGVGWVNATVTAAPGGRGLALTAALPPRARGVAAAAVRGSAYGWGPIPLMNAYDVGSALPVLPWNRTLSGAAPPPAAE